MTGPSTARSRQNGVAGDDTLKARTPLELVYSTDRLDVRAARAPTAPYLVAFRRGYMHGQNGQYKKAVDSLRKSIALKPDYAEAHHYLGCLLDETEKFADALSSFHTAIAISPEYAEAYLDLGWTLSSLGRDEDAIATYDDLLARFGSATESSLREEVAKAIFNKAMRFAGLGRIKDAVAACDDLITMYDDLLTRFGSAATVLHEAAARALTYKGGSLGYSEEAIAVYDDLLDRSTQQRMRRCA